MGVRLGVAAVSPKARFLRTVAQVLAALAVGIPSAAEAFDIPAGRVAQAGVAIGLLTALISAAVNGYEHASNTNTEETQ